MKGLFLSLPSYSVTKILLPVIREVVQNGHEMIYYNTEEFKPKEDDINWIFRSYPRDALIYYSTEVNRGEGFWELGEGLLNTAINLENFLTEEIGREKPDYIIYSHLACWGRFISSLSSLPSITLFTTFVLDKRIMLPFLKKLETERTDSFDNVKQLITLSRKLDQLISRFRLEEASYDIWDLFVNSGDLNLVFTLPDFQPEKNILNSSFHFFGYPDLERKTPIPVKERDRIYISMGTVFNGDREFYSECITALSSINKHGKIVIGNQIDVSSFGVLPDKIELLSYASQNEELRYSSIFVSRGGMASIQEAISAMTPLIIIPAIPEQEMNARIVEELGIGIKLSFSGFNSDSLQQAITRISNDYKKYCLRMDYLRTKLLSREYKKEACQLINNHLKNRYQ
ncbi:glycosyltransferase [Olivibacter sp. CPCC 100613]|uniref:glycosyltransferase n=1 Tax=Olivibacter sp. CPCC 100613 TaxID=3079931 RepID=UPI002FF53927